METNTCPVCQCVATFHGKRYHGEISRYCCPRCGKFQITGTALSMLKGRLSGVGNRYARLSHAIRRNQEEGDVWFQVTSVNIDELVDSPLPDITAQIENLIRWASRILGDDQLGSVDLANEEHLAAVVGTVDGSRVAQLLQYACDQGLINVFPAREIR